MTPRIAIECGGTRTRAALYGTDGSCLAETEGGGANPVDVGVARTVSALVALYEELAPEADTPPREMAVAAAGAGTADYATRIAGALVARLDLDRVIVTDDLTPILYANLSGRAGVLAIAGTGSSVIACAEDGSTHRVGGRGPLFDDPGSAYSVARDALIIAGEALDGLGPDSGLADALVRAAGVKSFDDFVEWNRTATKAQIADLAQAVNLAAEEGDEVAREILSDEASFLSSQVFAAAFQAALDPPPVVLVHGGVFENSRLFMEAFKTAIAERWKNVAIESPPVAGSEAVNLFAESEPLPPKVAVATRGDAAALPQTEVRRGDLTPLDRLSPLEIAEAMAEEDSQAAMASEAAAPQIGALVEATQRAFVQGGRIVYIGAGTSGRLGVLDASECHPTFGVPADRVVGIIAGGDRALRESIEGAEDDTQQAQRDLKALASPFCTADILIGISASGTTPYVRAAIDYARSLGSLTALIACNSIPANVADHVVCLDTGPERLPGSTRLKAGTATKMVLNQITTGVMALSGFVYEGYMVGVTPTNAKLLARAHRILSELLGLEKGKAGDLLDNAGGRIPVAAVMHRLGVDRAEAEQRLDDAGGSLRSALNES